jgi:hypothetical protein
VYDHASRSLPSTKLVWTPTSSGIAATTRSSGTGMMTPAATATAARAATTVVRTDIVVLQ